VQASSHQCRPTETNMRARERERKADIYIYTYIERERERERKREREDASTHRELRLGVLAKVSGGMLLMKLFLRWLRPVRRRQMQHRRQTDRHTHAHRRTHTHTHTHTHTRHSHMQDVWRQLADGGEAGVGAVHNLRGQENRTRRAVVVVIRRCFLRAERAGSCVRIGSDSPRSARQKPAPFPTAALNQGSEQGKQLRAEARMTHERPDRRARLRDSRACGHTANPTPRAKASDEWSLTSIRSDMPCLHSKDLGT
jgi:hypothetical protein